MIRFEVNGKPFDPQSFEETIMKSVMEQAAEQMRERIGSIRHPVTGEFPTIVVSGASLDDMKLRIEGSPELLELVRERMALTDAEDDTEDSPSPESTPKVFLSYASEDKALAGQIAHALHANGIDTWWDKWCMHAGDSLRQKIDEGLGDCTHFVVLLTPISLTKPWVNQEIDAALMRKIRSQVTLIPLRHNLEAEQLPPLLSGMLSPAIDNPETDIAQLINDIHGVTKKPPLGAKPAVAVIGSSVGTGYSAAATAIAKVFVEATKHALRFDPQFSLDELALKTGLSRDDVADALHELHGMADVHFDDSVWANDELFATFDRFWMPWNPSDDALKLASDMLNDDQFPVHPNEIAARYGWEPRRLNPAMAYLISRKLVRHLNGMDGGHFCTLVIQQTADTRRFVKSRS